MKTKGGAEEVPEYDEGNQYTDWPRKEFLSKVPSTPHTLLGMPIKCTMYSVGGSLKLAGGLYAPFSARM